MVKLIQTRFIIEGVRFEKEQLRDNNFWLVDNEILLKEIDNKLSAFVVSKQDDSFVANEEDYQKIGDDEEKKRLADDKWKALEEDAIHKIQSYIRLFPVLTKKTPEIVYSGSRQIASIDYTGRPRFSVVSSRVITTGLTINDAFLNKTKGLNKDIKELHERLTFLDTASKYYY